MKRVSGRAPSGMSPAVSGQLREQLERVSRLPDSLIDTSDISETVAWDGAQRGKFFRPVKRQLTLRIDAEVIAFFQQQAPNGGYQTAINEALREVMEQVLRQRQAAKDKRST